MIWRRERDSNPRYRLRYSGFQDRRLKPLGHPSARAARELSEPLEPCNRPPWTKVPVGLQRERELAWLTMSANLDIVCRSLSMWNGRVRQIWNIEQSSVAPAAFVGAVLQPPDGGDGELVVP